MNPIIVQKYGGTSVGSIEKIKNVATRVLSDYKKGKQMVVIVSAMGKFTDELVSLAKEINPNPSGREYDILLSTGEGMSAALLAMAIQEKGVDSISLSGRQAGVYTEDVHNKARILELKPERISAELGVGKIVIVTGFQGVNSQDDVTTIGRGGSDTSAVVIAGALNAERCEIYTDVDGVYTTNPSLIPDAKKLPEISYEEMLELASLGAGVLHPRAVEGAKSYGLDLHVRSSYNLNEGTIVKGRDKMEINNPVTGIAYDENTAKIAILGLPDQPGIAGDLFKRLAEDMINVDTIVQSNQANGQNDIAFTVSEDDFDKASTITEDFSNGIGAKKVIHEKDVTKVSIVGVGMVSSPGVAAQMFALLGAEKINIDLITTSEIKVSCIIASTDTKKAVSILHEGFELGK
jgi:aspartate kinase